MTRLLLILSCFTHILFASLSSDFIQSKTNTYQKMPYDEYELSIDLFTLLLTDKNPKAQKEYLQRLKLSLHRYKNTLVILDTAKRGWGFYIIKPKVTQGSLLSIPHRFNDIGTANIGKKLFLSYPYKAIAINTVSRKVLDMAHSDTTLFNAFHLAFIQSFPQAKTYQLHGFNPKTRSSAKGKTAMAIVSATDSPLALTHTIASCIRVFQDNVFVYAEDVFELGGTTNAQANLLKDKGYTAFTHIELSKDFRTRLRNTSSLRSYFHKCLP